MNPQNCRRLRATAILLLTLSLPFLSSPSAWAVAGDKANVSPGKVPSADRNPIFRNHYLGNSSFMVKLEYPRSFILQETVGDLAFTVSVFNELRRRIDIYIPPEFKVNTDRSYIWTNITNDYANVEITKAGSYDDVAPNWYKVSVSSPWPMELGNYSIRVFDVTAPSIVGLYFFKVFTDRTSIGALNFPSVIVSADPNPAYVSGTVKYGGKMSGYVYGNPLNLTDPLNLTKGGGGKVCAVGVTLEGRIVIGQAFFNASANYTLYGLAPGRYTLNATAAGYAPGELTYPIFLKAGQSLEGMDILLEHSPVTTVVALSRWMKQPAIWGDLRNGTMLTYQKKTITLEIFDLWNTTLRPFGLVNQTADPKATDHMFVYCGERDLDGHIPQENASYVGGIGPGRYFFRVWINGYVQPSAANEWVWRNECAVDYTRNEQNRRIEILLEKTGTLKVTVHFTNSTQKGKTLYNDTTPYDGTLTVEAYNLVEEMRARNSTLVKKGSRSASVELTGLFNTTRAYGLPPGEYIIFARWTLRTSTDTPCSVGAGYVSIGDVYLSSAYKYAPAGHRVTIGEGFNEISFYVVLQGALNLTVFPVTWQKPFKITAWNYMGSPISVEIRDKYGVESYGSFRLKQENNESDGRPIPVNACAIGLDEGIYSIYIFTYGYVQEKVMFFAVRRGEIADISAYVVEGARVDVTLVFQKQKIFYPKDAFIDTYGYWNGSRFIPYWNSSQLVPVRLEIYDSRSKFVGANVTYIPKADSVTSFSLFSAGFKSYRGSNATRWVNYYDTADGTSQNDYGLGRDWYTTGLYGPGPERYTLKVYVPGYYQKTDPVIEVRRGGETSVIILLERMAHLYGAVTTFNTYFGNYTRISWVNVDALGEVMTVRSCTLDGIFEMWLVPGQYLVVFSLPDYQDRSVRLSLPDGSDVQVDYQLLPLGFKP